MQAKFFTRDRALYRRLEKAFIGLETQYLLADGRTTRRIYLDSGASTLMMKPACQATLSYLQHYANTHTTVHTSAKITSSAIEWAHQRVLDFTGAESNNFQCTFIGNGTTAAANRVAKGLAELRPDKPMVLVSAMEHHSNDLPHRHYAEQVEHIPLLGEGENAAQIDVSGLASLLKKHHNKVNYVAITAVSNVTGIINPVDEISRLVHRYNAYLVVDGAQMVAHMPVKLTLSDIDFFLFSGHKVYAPGSPGVLIAKRKLIEAMQPAAFGGGMVSNVSKWGFRLADDPTEREYAGTPNIPGAITLACSLECLSRIGMQSIFEKEKRLVDWAIECLKQCPSIKIYGEQKKSARVASIAFNLKGIGHSLVAAILNDYHGIAVRNQCFCAHPYVQEMLTEEFEALANETVDNETLEALTLDRRGMVRISFGLYTQKEDITALVSALIDIEKNIENYRTNYQQQEDGSYVHKTYDSAA
ncbi:MAG TPA: aminotransferase class V-fold PLP-dependent enzyme, partial [Gammaproteobacteria bacterium]|nr:aminotransferase class V-fold PLP-dependent enzyme [Gammaproteobacteria bacterium]